MEKRVFKLFWSYDVLKTEEWLAKMHEKGFILKRINFRFRLFVFEKGIPSKESYRIIFDKKMDGAPQEFLGNKIYQQVCYSKNYYVLRTKEENIEKQPSYDGFLDRNKKLKYIIGLILLFLLTFNIFTGLILIVFLVDIINGNLIIENEITMPTTAMEIIGGIICLLFVIATLMLLVWMIYTYFKLKDSNSKLESLYVDKIDLDFSIPRETIISKEEMLALRKNKKLAKKLKIAWHYAPDKVETWLEKMAAQGYNLIRMSKLGNTFYFYKGKARKMKYHIDYQNKTDFSYFQLNKESGWKLYFTSPTSFQALAVWGQEYHDAAPKFYSDKESKVKQAKRFALTYSISFFPISLLYALLLVFSIITYKGEMIPFFIITALVMVEYGFFATRTILYYRRVKKQIG